MKLSADTSSQKPQGIPANYSSNTDMVTYAWNPATEKLDRMQEDQLKASLAHIVKYCLKKKMKNNIS